VGIADGGQSRALGRVRVKMVPGACFTPLQVLTDYRVKRPRGRVRSHRPKRDQRAVVGHYSRSGDQPSYVTQAHHVQRG
jgi:hypothetical protein